MLAGKSFRPIVVPAKGQIKLMWKPGSSVETVSSVEVAIVQALAFNDSTCTTNVIMITDSRMGAKYFQNFCFLSGNEGVCRINISLEPLCRVLL